MLAEQKPDKRILNLSKKTSLVVLVLLLYEVQQYLRLVKIQISQLCPFFPPEAPYWNIGVIYGSFEGIEIFFLLLVSGCFVIIFVVFTFRIVVRVFA